MGFRVSGLEESWGVRSARRWGRFVDEAARATRWWRMAGGGHG